MTKYQFFTKLPSISHAYENLNFNCKYNWKEIDQLLLPYKFYGRPGTCKKSTFWQLPAFNVHSYLKKKKKKKKKKKNLTTSLIVEAVVYRNMINLGHSPLISKADRKVYKERILKLISYHLHFTERTTTWQTWQTDLFYTGMFCMYTLLNLLLHVQLKTLTFRSKKRNRSYF